MHDKRVLIHNILLTAFKNEKARQPDERQAAWQYKCLHIFYPVLL